MNHILRVPLMGLVEAGILYPGERKLQDDRIRA